MVMRLYVMLERARRISSWWRLRRVHLYQPPDLNAAKREFATDRPIKTLQEAVVGADVFLGLSVANVLTKEMVQHGTLDPIVFALANLEPGDLLRRCDGLADDVSSSLPDVPTIRTRLHQRAGIPLYLPLVPWIHKADQRGDEAGRRLRHRLSCQGACPDVVNAAYV